MNEHIESILGILKEEISGYDKYPNDYAECAELLAACGLNGAQVAALIEHANDMTDEEFERFAEVQS